MKWEVKVWTKPLGYFTHQIIEALNKMGLEGWAVCAYHGDEYLLKRQIPEEPCPFADGIYRVTYPDGQVFEFEYEEMVELMDAGRKSQQGNEALPSMRTKADAAFKQLPVTNY